MRTSNRRPVSAISLALVALITAGCAAAPPVSAPPTPRPTPLVTPDPHLTAPARVDDVFRSLRAAGLSVTANNASAPGGTMTKRISATFGGWPLTMSEFLSVEALTEAGWQPGSAPVPGQVPYALAGLNILIEFGPRATNDGTLAVADPQRLAALVDLIAALDPVIGPLSQRSVEAMPLPTTTPRPSEASPSRPSGGSAEPESPSVAP